MPVNWRLDITQQNCWLCKYFRRDSESQTPNEGTCVAIAPKARGGVNNTATQDDINAHVTFPNGTYCGSYEPWTGSPREIIVPQE